MKFTANLEDLVRECTKGYSSFDCQKLLSNALIKKGYHYNGQHRLYARQRSDASYDVLMLYHPISFIPYAYLKLRHGGELWNFERNLYLMAQQESAHLKEDEKDNNPLMVSLISNYLLGPLIFIYWLGQKIKRITAAYPKKRLFKKEFGTKMIYGKKALFQALDLH